MAHHYCRRPALLAPRGAFPTQPHRKRPVAPGDHLPIHLELGVDMQKEQACGPSAEPGRARLTKVYKPHRAQVQPVRGLRASGSPGSGVVKSTAPVRRSSARAAQYQFWHRAVITTIRATNYGPAARRRQPQWIRLRSVQKSAVQPVRGLRASGSPGSRSGEIHRAIS
jgi:hypothetical protein